MGAAEDVESRLRRALDDNAHQAAALEAQHAEIIAASQSSNADDEHDPEGSTIAFERAQVATLLARVRHTREDLHSALERLAAGAYGACEACGQPIAPGRLEARPDVRTCVACATARSRRR